jgi:hypothetical protein
MAARILNAPVVVGGGGGYTVVQPVIPPVGALCGPKTATQAEVNLRFGMGDLRAGKILVGVKNA